MAADDGRCGPAAVAVDGHAGVCQLRQEHAAGAAALRIPGGRAAVPRLAHAAPQPHPDPDHVS